MAASLQSLLLSLDAKGEAAHRLPPTRLSVRTMELHALRRRKKMTGTKRAISQMRMRMRRRRRRTLPQAPRKPISRVKRQVRTLRRLLPSGESVGLDSLFREAADYIACLEMRVKVMQTMVRVLSGDPDE